MQYKIGQAAITKNSNNQNIFDNKKVIKIGVQGPSGFQFGFTTGNYITLGEYGIYELNLEGLGYISNFFFNPNSLDSSKLDTVYIDYVYLETGDATL